MTRIFLRIYCLILTVWSLFALFPTHLQAETRYVSDVLIISVRTGPGVDFRVISTIKTGTPMTVLEEQGEFIKVSTEQGVTGWVAKYYTEEKLPKSVVIQQLQSELKETRAKLDNAILANQQAADASSSSELIARIQTLSEEKETNEKTIAELTDQLQELTTQHTGLLAESRQVIETARERDRLKQAHSEMEGRLQTLDASNKSLKMNRMIYWFLTGAGVLLTGWIIGYSTRQKRARTISL